MLLLGIVVAVGGPLADSHVLAALGWLVYLMGIGLLAPPFWAAARARPPRAFPTFSVGAAALWLVGCLIALVARVLPAKSWSVVDARLEWFTPFLAAGFGVQLLLGAMSYLVPVALGGGPGVVRTATAVLDGAGLARVVATNAALLICVLPVPPAVRFLSSTVALVALASVLPLLVVALRASRAVRSGRREALAVAGPEPSRLRRQAALAVVVVVVILAALTGAGIDRGGLAWFRDEPVSAGVTSTGHTTVVEIETRDMRFHPSSIELPVGDRLVIELTNTDTDDVHDLVLDEGSDTGRLSPGDSARHDVGVVGRDVAGWCSVVGHRQMGMVLTVTATGTPQPDDTPAGLSTASASGPDNTAPDDPARSRLQRPRPAAPATRGRPRPPPHLARP